MKSFPVLLNDLIKSGQSMYGQRCSLWLMLTVPEFSLWGQERLKKQYTYQKHHNSNDVAVTMCIYSNSLCPSLA